MTPNTTPAARAAAIIAAAAERARNADGDVAAARLGVGAARVAVSIYGANADTAGDIAAAMRTLRKAADTAAAAGAAYERVLCIACDIEAYGDVYADGDIARLQDAARAYA